MVRYYSDPEYRRKESDKHNETFRLRTARDPTYVARRSAQDAQAYQRRISCERTRRGKRFNDWLRVDWHTANLPWKTHRPEVSLGEGVRHQCSGCQMPDHKTKFWWVSMAEPKRFLCGKCAFESSWEEVCPEGFEHAETFKEFTARAKELGIEKIL